MSDGFDDTREAKQKHNFQINSMIIAIAKSKALSTPDFS